MGCGHALGTINLSWEHGRRLGYTLTLASIRRTLLNIGEVGGSFEEFSHF